MPIKVIPEPDYVIKALYIDEELIFEGPRDEPYSYNVELTHNNIDIIAVIVIKESP